MQCRCRQQWVGNCRCLLPEDVELKGFGQSWLDWTQLVTNLIGCCRMQRFEQTIQNLQTAYKGRFVKGALHIALHYCEGDAQVVGVPC